MCVYMSVCVGVSVCMGVSVADCELGGKSGVR